jgi:uncharacterized protein (TIGR00251 family)
MISLTEHADGWVLPVRAQSGARKVGVVGEHAGALKLAVTAPPEGGRANDALAALLHELLGVKRSQVALVSGATRRDKLFLVSGLTKQELEKRLARLVALQR